MGGLGVGGRACGGGEVLDIGWRAGRKLSSHAGRPWRWGRKPGQAGNRKAHLFQPRQQALVAAEHDHHQKHHTDAKAAAGQAGNQAGEPQACGHCSQHGNVRHGQLTGVVWRGGHMQPTLSSEAVAAGRRAVLQQQLKTGEARAPLTP